MNKNTKALAILTLLFFMWGFITSMNDILIPYMKEVFELSNFKSLLVQSAFFLAYFIGSLAYFIASLSLGDPINKLGYKKTITFGLILSSIGCLLFVPASMAEVYALFLLALFVLGLGLTVLQISCNPIVILLGKPETASGRLNLTQAFNSLGTTLAPVVGGFFIFKFFASDGVLTAENVKMPYLMLSGLFIVVALLFSMSKIPSFKDDDDTNHGFTILKFAQVRWGMFGIFCYVGAEVAVGSLMIGYLGHDNVLGLDHLEASKYLAYYYWGGAMIGRFLGGININDQPLKKKALFSLGIIFLITPLIVYLSGLSISEMWPYFIFIGINLALFLLIGKNARLMLGVFALVNISFLVITILEVPGMMVWPILSIGLFNSIMWSNVFSLSTQGLGKYTSQGSSLLIMAILGGAIIPPLQGLVADHFTLGYSFLIPMLCYFYLFLYSVRYNKIYTQID
ncbi:sugar MFS transporter [Fulvivirga maritima]|uniref:sugar MFS transporter n=1 Tax=Fulvivirga maritima TaxID=2904247 RepID=UPI001F28C86E|nr:sugar MFS transporter [Fulvivirga maritima]UII25607.1 sugar MFS transporter [Fulvivirga maritima]